MCILNKKMKNKDQKLCLQWHQSPAEKPGRERGIRKGNTLWAFRASFEIRRLPTKPATGSFLRMQCNVGFREGQPTLVNIAEVSD